MKKIGNILFSKDKNCELLYNLCTKETMRPGIPSLIVGWDNVKKLYPNQNIIDWKIDDNTYWTFGKREKRDKYESNISVFKKISEKALSKCINYEFIDLLSCEICEKQILNQVIIDTLKRKTVLIINDIVYLYTEGENKVIGFSLRDIEYSGKKKNAILSIILSNKSINVVSNIPIEIRNEFRDIQYILAYLYSE